ncbi:uncharacterized protein LOC141527354 [Cotesia typhae]|uniref:uncharacterized protein LOC141527354 n=1 Tax=Cotesia typhae TaxID=2053667 RepID=UPI003D691561
MLEKLSSYSPPVQSQGLKKRESNPRSKENDSNQGGKDPRDPQKPRRDNPLNTRGRAALNVTEVPEEEMDGIFSETQDDVNDNDFEEEIDGESQSNDTCNDTEIEENLLNTKGRAASNVTGFPEEDPEEQMDGNPLNTNDRAALNVIEVSEEDLEEEMDGANENGQIDTESDKENASAARTGRFPTMPSTSRPLERMSNRTPRSRVKRLKKSHGNKNTKNGNAPRLSQQQQTQPRSRIPKLTETIIVENDIEYIKIGTAKFTSNELSTIILKRSMQKRAKALLNKLWSPEFLLKLYQKLPKDDDGSGILLNDIHCLRVKDMCFYLQEKKEIPYREYKDDNIDLYLPRWISTWCNENRRQNKKNNIPGNT